MADLASGPLDDEHLRAAIRDSHLCGLPDDVLEALSHGARRTRIGAGTRIRAEEEARPHLDLVVAGLIRIVVSAPDGRTMTVRYCRTGALIGVATLFSSVLSSFSIHAVTASELVRFEPMIASELAARDSRLAIALLAETSERVLTFIGQVSMGTFATVRERVAHHLLDMASDRQRGDHLLVEMSQQELADAVGSVREVVVRTLRELRQEGVVETGRGWIRIRDPERLLPST